MGTKVLSGTIDEYILGRFDIDSEFSPYSAAGEKEPIKYYLCNYCLNDDITDEDDVVLACDIKNLIEVHICLDCANCLDDEEYINIELRKKMRKDSFIKPRPIESRIHEPVGELIGIIDKKYKIKVNYKDFNEFPGLNILYEELVRFRSENNEKMAYESTRSSIRIMLDKYVYNVLYNH